MPASSFASGATGSLRLWKAHTGIVFSVQTAFGSPAAATGTSAAKRWGEAAASAHAPKPPRLFPLT